MKRLLCRLFFILATVIPLRAQEAIENIEVVEITEPVTEVTAPESSATEEETDIFVDAEVSEVSEDLESSLSPLPDVPPVREESPVLKFKPKQLIAPLSLFAVGAAGVYWGSFKKLNVKIRDGFTDLRKDHKIKIDDYFQYLPAAAYLGLALYKKRKLDFRERLAVGITSYLAMTALVNISKYSFREKRPDHHARHSFPSGHTATAFTGAELIRHEFGWGIGSAAYVVATGVAFLRLYNGRHWLNDVIGGAGIGILSARIGYWMLPLYRKWFKWDKNPANPVTMAVPSVSTEGVALNMTMIF
ncbi:MAG: phosphatase PAP2 family protein [Muribaculaceae bacterium]|nr:phosphatase PAP2 family protein [Muribaculaceae bacterium]